MSSVTRVFYLDTTADLWAEWATDCIRQIRPRDLMLHSTIREKLPNGKYVITTSRAFDDWLAGNGSAGSEITDLFSTVASNPKSILTTIMITPLSPTRVKVQVDCWKDEAERFFYDLLEATGLDYPESKLQEQERLSDDVNPGLLVEVSGLSGRDRRLLAMWQRGDSAPSIAQHLHIATRTVYNKTSEWRSIYGETAVPKRR